MARRGGYRLRRYVVPADVPAWISSGRWGPRRVRVERCVTLRAELVYGQMICEGAHFAPGARATLSWKPHGGIETSWEITVEVLPNAVWRRGRLFLRCRHCDIRATRLYVPVEGLEPRCRRCWGLSYESQSWSYKASGFLGGLFGPVAYLTTSERRKERQRAARARYDIRREFL